MIRRICNLSQSKSFFLYGGRGTGKSTLLRDLFKDQNPLWIDLLNPDLVNRYQLRATAFLEDVQGVRSGSWVVVDEIQKVPKLLDLIHQLIEEKKIKFALTGSSARKLKRGSANLLAGRASVFHLYPFSYFELEKSLDELLAWGALPGSILNPDIAERKRFLSAYSNTYLKEEILQEQIVRNIEPFVRFLPVAAAQSGKIVNFAAIARDAGVDPKSVERYFQILEDTLLSFRLPAHHHSLRKQQALKPKVFLFDLGVKRSLDGSIHSPPTPSTSDYGHLFEHFILLECFKLNDYFETDYRFSYLRTKDGAEIDLIVERGRENPILIEIKSKGEVFPTDFKHLKSLGSAFKNAKKWVFARTQKSSVIEGVQVFPWAEGLQELWPEG